jgi:hypothetical protein
LKRSNHCKYVGGKLTPKTDYLQASIGGDAYDE